MRTRHLILFFPFESGEKLTPAELDRPENTGKKAIPTMSADDYFLGGDAGWQVFIRDHYNNFYCSYYACRKFRPGGGFFALSDAERVERARNGVAQLDLVCPTTRLDLIEDRLLAATDRRVSVTSRRVNPGPLPKEKSRWDALRERFESDKSPTRIKAFTALDDVLFEEIVKTC